MYTPKKAQMHSAQNTRQQNSGTLLSTMQLLVFPLPPPTPILPLAVGFDSFGSPS